jgi:hypothetical protein
MASIDFPNSPTIDDLFTAGSRTWIWTGSTWVTAPVEAPTSTVQVSATPPSNPNPDDLWWDTDDGTLYIYYDNFWVQAVTGVVGPEGAAGLTGPAGSTGPSGVIAVTAPITNSGTSTSATLGLGVIETANLPAGPADSTLATAATGFGFVGIPQNATTTGSYTLVAADAGRHIYASATRMTTIPDNSQVALPIGTTVVFIAGSGATMTINIGMDTLLLAGPGTTGSRTLAPFGIATAVKITATSWLISGNGLT